MPTYLIQGSYTTEGLKGLLKEGGNARRAVAAKLIAEAGGRLEAYYFALGESDFYAIVELPNNVAVTAVSLIVNGSGALKARTVVLVAPEEVDQAVKKGLHYRPPGQ